MKSKEAIRNQITSYAGLVWGIKKTDRLDILIKMMIDGLTDELYLLQNKLDDIDAVLLEKIAVKLPPQKSLDVRPPHTVLQITPPFPAFSVSKDIPFFLDEASVDMKRNNTRDAIPFYPVAQTQLFNIKLKYLFHHEHLSSINEAGKRRALAQARQRQSPYRVWLGLEIDERIHDIENLTFYIDFPELPELHDYYEVLPYTRCLINGKEIRVKRHYPHTSGRALPEWESHILQTYEVHYLAIDQPVNLRDIKQEKLPPELQGIIDPEAAGDIKPLYWIELLFRPNFSAEDLGGMLIAVNTFPVANKKYRKQSVAKDKLEKAYSLPSDIKEKLLAVDSVTDSENRNYRPDISAGRSEGTYHLEMIRNLSLDGQGLIDHIERLLDLIEEERVAFPDIDKDKAGNIITSIENTEDDNIKKADDNTRLDNAEIGRISVTPYENAEFVNIGYWVTYGELTNGIPAGEIFFPNKASPLDGLVAVSLCEIHGGKEITDIRDILYINQYVITSKDKIITEHNILSFCKSELGQALGKAGMELGAKISPKPKEGLIKVINLKLAPAEAYPGLLYRKGVLRDLKIRLQQRSPDHYNYEIIIEKTGNQEKNNG